VLRFKKIENALDGDSRRVFPPVFRRIHIAARQLFIFFAQRVDPIDDPVEPIRNEGKGRGKSARIGFDDGGQIEDISHFERRRPIEELFDRDLRRHLDEDRSAFEIPSLGRVTGALASDDEVDLAGCKLQLQVVAWKFISSSTDHGARFGIGIWREGGNPVRVRHEDVDVVTDAMIKVHGERSAAAKRPRHLFRERINQRERDT